MKLLKSLQFTTLTAQQNNPIVMRRAKLIQRLEQQKALANDPLYLQTSRKWLVNEQGVKQLIELKKRVRAWWRIDATGAVALTVRYGAKAIEFEKGKAAITIPSKDELVATLDTVISAVRAGELDEHLAQHAKARGVPKPKRAAERVGA